MPPPSSSPPTDPPTLRPPPSPSSPCNGHHKPVHSATCLPAVPTHSTWRLWAPSRPVILSQTRCAGKRRFSRMPLQPPVARCVWYGIVLHCTHLVEPPPFAYTQLPTCATPTVHSGFRKRASSVPIMDIWKQARAAGKRLVLTGHSLGGSVAQVCALTLLRSVPEARSNNLLHCVSYATPAIGNSALQRAVEASGWDKLFINIALPEDVVPHLLSWTPPPRKTTPQRSARRPTHVQTTQLMTTTLFSILLQSLLPQSSAAAAITAPLRAFAQHTSELSGLIRMLPLAGAVAMPFLLPANILWSAGLFACYVGIACLKSTIRLGPQHYYMIGRQYLVGADGALRSGNKDGVDGGGESDNMSVWLHGCSGGKHPAPVGPRRPRSWLARVQWHYAMHRMPPLRTRLQAAQSFCAGGADDTIGAFLLCG